MEWLEKRLEEKPAIKNNFNNIFDLNESAQFKWVEDISPKGVFKLFDLQENKIKGSIKIRNGFKKSALCNIFNKNYSMKKKGLFDPRVIINEDNNNDPVSTFYYYNWKGDGELLFADGVKYFWEPYNRLNNEWMFYDQHENELIHFKPMTSFYKSGYFIKIKDENLNQKTVLIFIMFGIFNLITSAEEVSDDAPIM
jgi:hypothetical protein